jgi:hypothetical protein
VVLDGEEKLAGIGSDDADDEQNQSQDEAHVDSYRRELDLLCHRVQHARTAPRIASLTRERVALFITIPIQNCV